jgi:hypothetical protein
MSLNEADVEQITLSWLGELGYSLGYGPELAPGEASAERTSFADVVLEGRLREAIWQLNPQIPKEAREEALLKIRRADTASLLGNNRAFHRMLRDGVEVEYKRPDGSIAGDRVQLVNYADPAANDWLAVNQFTVVEGQHNRRPDIVIFINGLPVAVIELKSAADEDATIWSAYHAAPDLQSRDPLAAALQRAPGGVGRPPGALGSLTANQEWFKVWRTIDGEQDAPKTALELEVLLRGVFEPRRFLDLLQHFIAFEEDPDTARSTRSSPATTSSTRSTPRSRRRCAPAGSPPPPKPTAASRATAARVWSGTPRAAARASRCSSSPPGWCATRRCRNPTLVVLTDRNDLDDQLFGQFQRCHEILGQAPVQAAGREHLRELLTGGQRRRRVHDDPKVHAPPKGEDAGAERAPQHRRHRRRGAPQPVRPRRRARPQPARRAAPTRPSSASPARRSTRGREHAGDLWRLHQHLRHPASGRRQGDGADLLREPDRQAGAERRRAAHWTTSSRRSPRARRTPAASSSSRSGPRSRRWSAIRSGSSSSPPTWSRTSSGGWRRWTARR